jgi:hypothetical protein
MTFFSSSVIPSRVDDAVGGDTLAMEVSSHFSSLDMAASWLHEKHDIEGNLRLTESH